MSEINIESSSTESIIILPEAPAASTLDPSSTSTNTDDEARRRRILSKLWGKGNKLSHKVRELEKNTGNVNESSNHNDNGQKESDENPSNPSIKSSTTDLKAFTEDSSNSISNAKPLAVVKPIVVVKSGRIISTTTDRTRVNSEVSSVTVAQVDETVATTSITTVTERQSLSSTLASTSSEQTSNKKRRNHKEDNSRKHKTTKDESADRNRSHHHHHEINSNKKNDSSSTNNRHDQNEESIKTDEHSKSSRQQSSSTKSGSKSKRRSRSHEKHRENRQSSRSTASKKEESTSAKKPPASPTDHQRQHSSSKYDRNTDHTHSSHRHRHRSSRSHSRSPPRSHHSTSHKERLESKTSSSPKKDDRDRNSLSTTKSNRQQSDSTSNSKSTNPISPSDSSSKIQCPTADTNDDNDHHRQKTRVTTDNLKKSSKSVEVLPEHHPSLSSVIKQETSKPTPVNDKNESDREKPSSSRHDRRSHSRHRSKSKENKTNRKPIETPISDDSSNNQNKQKTEKTSTTNDDHSQSHKRSGRASPISSSTHDRRRKSSSDHHRHDRHESPSSYDRRNDSHHYRYHDSYHRTTSSHSYYPHTHYVHHHHHHHYRPKSSRYHDRHRSKSPHSHHHRSRYFSSTSSSLSGSPRRRSSSRTSSSSSRSSSSYSSLSRTSSSRSSSRNRHYYYSEKKFRRSPTLEKIFLKASESIESVSTQKNPTVSSSSTTTSHLIPVQTSNNLGSEVQVSSSRSSLSDTSTFYAEKFSGFSAPPPPFLAQPHQRYLKEITTESTTPRRSVLNEVQASQSTPLSNRDEVLPVKPTQANDVSNVRSGKPPRVSRFSDVAPSTVPEPVLNTNLSVDTVLNYTQINENINCLPSSRRQQKRHNREVMECECTTSEEERARGIKACGHECLNRMLLIECDPKCPCGQWCTNRRFQRRSYANHKLALFKTEMKGFGLRTISPIHKGRFLAEYVGEVIDMDELARRNKKYKRDGNVHQYVMSLVHGTVIDSTMKGNWARFINHCCEPNCAAEKWLVNGEYRLGIFATRDLDTNEEITIDYRFETFGTTDLTNEKCYCGAPTCRGTISIRSNNNNNSNNQRQDRRQPLDDDEILQYLFDGDTNEYVVPKSIDEIRHLIQIMSRTDSENVRIIELDLVRNGSKKLLDLPRLFLGCNGLHVLCSWMKDILIEDDEQQYSDEFKYNLLDFIHCVLPIKDRTTVIKNGLLDLVYKKIKLPTASSDVVSENDENQIKTLMDSMLDHLDNRITAKLFHIYATWMSLKERYTIPKRKEPEPSLSHPHRHHHHHHHHSSKYSSDDNNYRYNFASRSSSTQYKTNDRSYNSRRSFVVRDTPRTQEQQLSKDERRKLFEQQYEDEERARLAAAAAATANSESPTQNEPPQKKQRTTDDTESNIPHSSPQQQPFLMSTGYPWSMPSHTTYADQTYWIHHHLSQIPVEYIRSYMMSIGQTVSGPTASSDKDETPLPPPPRPDDENELRRIISLPPGWSVTTCPSDSSVYFYNRVTMETSWTPPSLSVHTETSDSMLPSHPPLDLSPLSSAQIHGQHRTDLDQQELTSSSHSLAKLLKHSHRHSRSHRHHHHHHHHHMMNNNKRKRSVPTESINDANQEPSVQSTEQISAIISTEQFKPEESDDRMSTEGMCVDSVKSSADPNSEHNTSITVKDALVNNDNDDNDASSSQQNLSSSSKMNRDLLRKNISQHVHTTLKPYTKRTCRQGRITSTEDIKYLVKKFTLAVLDKEIEKAKNDGIQLSPVLSERVKLKTELYVKKYMNKVGPIFQRHDLNTQPLQQAQQTTATTTTLPTTTMTTTSSSE